MRTLLLTALLLAHAGAARAEAPAPPAKAEKPVGAAGRSRAVKAKKVPPKPSAKADRKGPAEAAPATAAPENKPCEPVKPCPID